MVTNNERKGVHIAPQFQMGYDSTHHSMQQGGKKASHDFQMTPYPVIMLPLLIPLEKGTPQLGRGQGVKYKSQNINQNHLYSADKSETCQSK